MTKQTIFSLMKIISCEKRAEQVLDGQLYCNTISFMREQFDEYEGTVPLPGTLRIEDFTIPKEDLAEPPLLMPKLVSDLNVFCMFCWAAPNVGGDNILFDPVSQLGSIRTLVETFGEHTVVIKNVTEFFRRVDKAAAHPHSGALGRTRGIVTYSEPSPGEAPPTTPSALLSVALRKRKRFANEKEYRFVYLTGRDPAGPFILNVGDIRDIAFRMRTQEVYERAEMNGRPLSDY
ncbi:MAG: hypothetical protein OXU81_13665 [Gammaproteobacteria bacterium]|nr:hypothetical protein [Gammaproteobacteria bacterium]